MGSRTKYAVFAAVLAYLVYNNYINKPLVKGPIVEVSTGKLQGIVSKSRDGRDFFEYLGVPYALPPVDQRRYEPPQPLTVKWEGVRDATKLGAECLQVDGFFKKVMGSEDCLFVNIHTPKLGNANKLPVLFWIHGGLFSFGSGNTYRPDYLMDEDVVIVTVNYRLGSFGFLNTGDGLVRGNMGLKDQSLALRWVRDNIGAFGGNPNDVTIFGESAGGASVHYQLLSPMSKGLFHKAICQSGLTTMAWSYYPSPEKQAKRFAEQAGCKTSSTKEMVECLKGLDAMHLVNLHMEMTDSIRPMISVFLPTIEKPINDSNTFISQKPMKLIEKGEFTKVPLLTGVNSAEGLLMSAPIVANKTLTTLLKNEWAKTLKPLIFLTEDSTTEHADKIKAQYLPEEIDLADPFKHIVPLTRMVEDWVWLYGFNKGISNHVEQTPSSIPTFLYFYKYEGTFSLDALLLSLKGDYHPIIEILLTKIKTWITEMTGGTIIRYGACHGDELAMEWHMPGLAHVPKDSKDFKFSKEFLKTIMQFVRLDPKSTSPQLKFLGQTWTPQGAGKPLSYMEISLEPKMIPEPFKARLVFWEKLNLMKNIY